MFSNPGLRPVEGVLLYTDEDWRLGKYIRYNFASLDQMTGHHLNLYAIEQPSKVKGISGRAFWKSVLDVNTYRFLNLLGWTQHSSYNKADAYKIANILGLYPEALPCVVLFGNIKSDEKIVVTLSGEIQTFFRILSSKVLATIEDLHKRDVKLYDNFAEFKKVFLDKWGAEGPRHGTGGHSRTFIFNGDTVFINKPSGDVNVQDFQKGDES
jgi:hypothetical protein